MRFFFKNELFSEVIERVKSYSMNGHEFYIWDYLGVI